MMAEATTPKSASKMAEYMRKKRKENPGYGKPKTWRQTPAYCTTCHKEQEWRDATVIDGWLCCPVCRAQLYSIRKQENRNYRKSAVR